jgi:hypothetical protein
MKNERTKGKYQQKEITKKRREIFAEIIEEYVEKCL